ncbi:MAG: mechanosensitive ion channel domain-containing protein [Clostridia bacterium]
MQVSTVNQEGTVEEIGIFNTSLRTPDNEKNYHTQREHVQLLRHELFCIS